MGFNLTAFAGGFAQGLVEDIEKEEKLAEARATAGVKNMYETYQQTMAENKKLKSSLVDNISTLRAYDPSATDDELFEIAKSKPLMELITAKVKSGEYDAQKIKLSNFATVAASDNPATAMERVNALFELPKVVEEKRNEEQKRSGNFIRDIISGAGETASETTALRTAQLLGVPLDQLKAAAKAKTPSIQSSASVNMEAFQKRKDPNQIINDLKVDAWTALQAGNEKGYVEAKNKLDSAAAVLIVDKDLKQRLGRLQVELQDTKDPTRAKQLQNIIVDLQRDIKISDEAIRVKSPEERKAPSLGTLEAAASSQIKRVLEAQYGDKITKGIAFTPLPTGGFDIKITATDPEFRKELVQQQQKIVKSYLSGYDQTDVGIQTVINAYDPANYAIKSNALPVDQGSGNMPKSKSAAPTQVTSVDINAIRKDAEDAINKGANREAVAKQFKLKTGQEF